MPFPRLQWPSLFVRAFGLLCLFGAASSAINAQSATFPATPAATQGSAADLPSMPAATNAPPPSQSPQQPTPSGKPAYDDPLTRPIVIGPATPGTTPAAMPSATPGTTPATMPGATPATMPSATPGSTPVHIDQPTVASAASFPSIPAFDFEEEDKPKADALGSSYISVDSPIYPMALRLYSMGYLDTAFISMRPWTRRSLVHMLAVSQPAIMEDGNDQAVAILAKLNDELAVETPAKGFARGRVYGVESVYTRLMSVYGQTLRDSYHLGETLNNDYGRPYEPGFNNITGFSTVNEWGRFSFNLRGEYQHSPSAVGYSYVLANTLSCLDSICPFAAPNAPQDTIPYGYLSAQNPFRLTEASVSFHILGHEISGGKNDSWLSPAEGGAFAWSNNAENIYAFRINRVEPMHIPLLSWLLGPLRYDFQVGSLKGHTSPNDPWIHSEMFAFRPTANFEFGFQRTVIWGGKGHEPVTLHTFFRSFFDINDTTYQEKDSPQDPGARFTAFNFSWRLPFLHHYVTLYTDSEAHDDVTPPSAPRRAAYRPGFYISQFPGRFNKFDFRIEAVSTDTSTLRSLYGQFNYFEGIQKQGYTNKGFILGDWIGREAKGGQAWITYHLSANEWIQLEYLNKKTPKDFIANGTTQNQFKIDVMKRFFHDDLEVHAWAQIEKWKAPIYLPGSTVDSVAAAQITWFPKLRTAPVSLNGK